MLLTPKSSKISLIKNIVLPQGYKNSFQKSKGQAEGQRDFWLQINSKQMIYAEFFPIGMSFRFYFCPPHEL